MAAPKARGRQAALAQLAEKQYATGGGASGAGGAGLLSPPAGGGGPSPMGGGVGRSVASERTTFAERVGDVKENVERARAEYRSRAAGALGAPPSSGPSVVVSAMHQRFANLEASWGEVMDYAKIDPFATATPGVNAASAALSRNRHGLDEQVNSVLADLWDGVSSGQSRTMTDARKDTMMQEILRAPGGMQLSPNKHQQGGYGKPGSWPQQAPSASQGLALQMPAANRMQQHQGHDQQQLDVYAGGQDFAPPPAGAQDFETRRQLEMLREDIMGLEEQVLQAVEAQEAELPPPPPLVYKHQGGLKNMNQAAYYEEIVHKIRSSEIGFEPDSGGTPCNSIDDPNVPLIMPPKGGMKIRQQIEHLQKECKALQEATVQEIGGEAIAKRMKEAGGRRRQ